LSAALPSFVTSLVTTILSRAAERKLQAAIESIHHIKGGRQ
jgi:hypothetical protein